MLRQLILSAALTTGAQTPDAPEQLRFEVFVQRGSTWQFHGAYRSRRSPEGRDANLARVGVWQK